MDTTYSKNISYLLSSLQEREKEKNKESLKPKINIKTSVGLFAFVYERVRNFVDYQEEHLLLRRAISRVLVRRAKNGEDAKNLALSLVTELLMARYLGNDSISEEKLPKIEKIINKYFLLYGSLEKNYGSRKIERKDDLLSFLLSLAGREIDDLLVPSNDDLLVNFALKEVEERTSWQGGGSEEERRTRLLIGLMRTLSKDDDRTIFYKLWKVFFSNWTKGGQEVVLETAKNFESAYSMINRFIKDGSGESMVRILRKQIAPFEILRDVINYDFKIVEDAFSSQEKLAKVCQKAADDRYKKALALLRRSAVNSFIYIFITKMVLALAIEVPYELYIASHIRLLPIFINLFFPPSLMLFMSLTVESPTVQNTERIVREISAVSFGEGNLPMIRIDLLRRKFGVFKYIFGVVYSLAFVIAFGLTVFVLRKLHFSIVSLGIFFFFLSTISFFAFRIRSAFKELVVGEEGSNFVSTIFDFFMLPFIKLGRLISTGLETINVFTFIFDIILESPFKTLLEILEELTKFLREKKEEALTVIK